MKHIHVTCAIIERDGLVLAAQRSVDMNQPLKWEFPGGQIQSGESREACVQREIREELGVEIKVSKPLPSSTHAYSSVKVTLYPYVCTIANGEPVLLEHADMIWMLPGELSSLDWAGADIPVLADYCRHIGI